MSSRTFALVFGVAFLLIGISGFVPGLLQPPHEGHPQISLDTGYGQVFGLFPVNVLHNIVHILFGIWGLMASKSIAGAKTYGRATAIIYAVLTLAGLVPTLNTMFGLVPLFGNDVWLHALLAAIAGYFGWVHRDAVNDRG